MRVDVVIYVPYLLEDAAGNSVSALRMRRQLQRRGLSVIIVTPRDHLVPARCLIALNAWRSSKIIHEFKGKVVVFLTGTDINHPKVNQVDWHGRSAMDRADRLVVLQEEAFQKVPEPLKEKCQVILPSVSMPEHKIHRGSRDGLFRVILGARLRPEKQAGLVLEACRKLKADAKIRVEWYGAISYEEAPHFQWRGPVAQEELWEEMTLADAFLNASSEEGGANAVCEAMTLGLPVIASRIGGNVGLLGDEYQGYFTPGDSDALALLLENPPLEKLKKQILARQDLFTEEREAREWGDLVAELLK